MIYFEQKGDFSNTKRFMERLKEIVKCSNLDVYGKKGVAALSAATPVDTGLTANSWKYEITHNKESATISFTNTNIQNGVPIAVILQYEHATRNGG